VATVLVNSATGFSSDDFFGPENATLSALGAGSVAFNAYGIALTDRLTLGLTPAPVSGQPYAGSLAFIEARATATLLATLTFTPPIAVNWGNAVSGFSLAPPLWRFANPALPSIRFAGADDMTGNAGGDIFRGYGGNDVLRGEGGEDWLFGGSGNDTLIGGAAGDRMVGDAGNDTFVINGSDGSNDSIYGGASDGAMAAGEINTIQVSGNAIFQNMQISQIQRLQFVGGGTAEVNSTRISPIGLSTKLAVVGSASADTLIVIVNGFGASVDLSKFSFSNWNAGADQLIIQGGIGDETLIGSVLNDLLRGAADGDTLDGRGGADTAQGGPGDDIYYINHPGDVVDEGIGGSDGNDTVFASLSFSLSSPRALGAIEHLTLTGKGNFNATGNSLANTLTGNNGNNVLNGLGNNDLMFGRGGNDTHFYDSPNDIISEVGGSGIDTVRAFLNFDLGAAPHAQGALENLVLFGAAFDGRGNALNNVITGNGLDNDLRGFGGNDVLDGKAGTDQLVGGNGRDTFRFSSKTHSGLGANADSIVDFDDAGNDVIDVSALFGPVMVYRHNLGFTAAGQVRIRDIAGPDLFVEVNTGGTLAADFSIRLTNTTLASMNAGDFIL
jgi:Ca2+-binding RTX toxin-like protein